MNIDKVIKQLERSPIWEELNKKANLLYEQYNRIPTKEEYQKLRNILIYKTILEDPNVKEEMMQYIYNESGQFTEEELSNSPTNTKT